MADPTLDPDLEQVLVDIAADPRSSLFITDPRKVLTGLQDGSLETPASRTGLRPAERHLLEVYRHELAFLLRQVYRVELARKDTVHVQPNSTTHVNIASRVSTYLKCSRTNGAAENHLRTFKAKGPADPIGILATSLALHSDLKTIVCLANEEFDRGQQRTARRLFTLPLQRPSHPGVSYCALEGIALVDEESGKLGRSLESYSLAQGQALLVSVPHALTSTANILRLSLSRGTRSKASESAKWIDANFTPSNSTLKENVRALRAAATLTPNPCDSRLVQDLLESSTASAREVINAIAS